MDWRGIIFWSVVLFKGLYCDSTLPEERVVGESCYLLNADGREIPGETNDVAGNLFNLFPNLTVARSGRIKTITFFTYNTGNAYVAFWRPLGNHTFQLRTKVQVSSNTTNHLEVYFPTENHYVEEGNVLGIHYKDEPGWDGLIAYEWDRSWNGPRTEGMLVYDFYNPSYRDDSWPIGYNITLVGLKGFKKGVALHIDICECKNNAFGEDCQPCSEHCLEQPCNPITGHCQAGCKDGYQGFSCDTVCRAGTYGLNCSQICSGNCIQGNRCDSESGHCANGCKEGYDYAKSRKCDQKCGFQRFGAFCAGKCHCRSNTTCDAQYGTCLNGCADGWEGITCSCASTQNRGGRTSNSDNTGWIVAVVILTVLVASLATSTVVLAVIWQRSLKAKSTPSCAELTVREMSFNSTIRPFSKNPIESSEKETESTYEKVAEVAASDVIKPEYDRLNVYQNE